MTPYRRQCLDWAAETFRHADLDEKRRGCEGGWHPGGSGFDFCGLVATCDGRRVSVGSEQVAIRAPGGTCYEVFTFNELRRVIASGARQEMLF